MIGNTPARIGIGRCGTRYTTAALLDFRAAQAAAADAVFSEVPKETVAALGLFEVQSCCKDKQEMLKRPDLGRLLSEAAKKTLLEKCKQDIDVQIYCGDGLCSPSIGANIPDLLPAIIDALEYEGVTVGTPFFVRYCRVNTVRDVSELLKPKVTCVLIGERPGLITDESMSAYIAYKAGYHMSECDYNVIANISKKGMPPVEAAAHITEMILAMLEQQVSGVALKR